MINKEKAQKLLSKLATQDESVREIFDPFDKELASITGKLKETLAAKTIDEIKTGYQAVIDALAPLEGIISKVRVDLDAREQNANQAFSDREAEITTGIHSMIDDFSARNQSSEQNITNYSSEIETFKKQLEDDRMASADQFNSFRSTLSAFESKINTSITSSLSSFQERLKNTETTSTTSIGSLTDQLSMFTKNLEDTKKDFINRINNIGGGSMNRQILVENQNPLKKYTDINFYGVNASIITSVDTVHKRINIGIQGGGGGGSGTVTSVLAGTGIVVDSTTPATPIVKLGNSSVVTGTYGSATQVGQFTVDQQGRITAASLIGISSGSGTPGGNTTQIQYNKNSVFGGISGATTDGSILTLANPITNQFTVNSFISPNEFFLFANKLGVGIPVPFFQPTVSNKSLALDLSPNGTPGNTFGIAPVWVDILSTDINNANYEVLRIAKQDAGVGFITTAQGGSGSYRDLVLQYDFGNNVSAGKVGIGVAVPQEKLHVGTQGSTAGIIRMDGATTGFVNIQPASVAGNWKMTLPSNAGISGQYLRTDGNGITQWASVAAGTGSPAAPTTAVQFNDGGNFGGSSGFTFDKSAGSEVLIVGSGDDQLSFSKGVIINLNANAEIPYVSLEGSSLGNGEIHIGFLNLRSDSGDGGSIEIQANSGGALGGAGGTVLITAGPATAGNNDGGSIAITPGLPSGSGQKGQATFVGTDNITIVGLISDIPTISTNGSNAQFSTSILSADRLYNFPDKNGTFAMLSDITGSGITRTTSIITANTTGSTAANTDYVYFVNAGVRFNLPSIVGAGTNMQTVKNMTTSSVLVVSSEGIDDGPTALLTLKYQSLSFIPNGSIWGVV